MDFKDPKGHRACKFGGKERKWDFKKKILTRKKKVEG